MHLSFLVGPISLVQPKGVQVGFNPSASETAKTRGTVWVPRLEGLGALSLPFPTLLSLTSKAAAQGN